MKKVYTLKEIVGFAMANSSFYGELYKNIDPENFQLKDLPVIEQEKFWMANNISENSLLTGAISDGIVLKSGGTTGHPKFSIFTKTEWENFTQIFGMGLDQSNLSPGDRVVNLFYSGELYASFIFIMKSLEHARTKVVHFPVAGKCPPEQLIRIIQDFNVNVLAGVPTFFMNFVAALKKKDVNLNIEKILYGGEELYRDQRERLIDCFPGVKISSIGYASVDGGHLGYVDKSCGPGEHCVFSDSSIMELVDENTGESITELNVPGRLIFTNLARKLMPIIRYPVGDKAQWVSTEVVNGELRGTRFLLGGRSEEGARIGPVTMNRDDFLDVLSLYERRKYISNFQLIIEHYDGKDELTWRIAVFDRYIQQVNADLTDIMEIFYGQRKMFKEAMEEGFIHPIKIEIVLHNDLVQNRRTGKLRSVIDRRE
ncbi:MAG: phenylacetate--CoA ligase family protein [Bacteriovoracaceae bacterium]|nr:phenylacetate--CoA ligase family protein [Bacteriovoracaceae bacterium]